MVKHTGFEQDLLWTCEHWEEEEEEEEEEGDKGGGE